MKRESYSLIYIEYCANKSTKFAGSLEKKRETGNQLKAIKCISEVFVVLIFR